LSSPGLAFVLSNAALLGPGLSCRRRPWTPAQLGDSLAGGSKFGSRSYWCALSQPDGDPAGRHVRADSAIAAVRDLAQSCSDAYPPRAGSLCRSDHPEISIFATDLLKSLARSISSSLLFRRSASRSRSRMITALDVFLSWGCRISASLTTRGFHRTLLGCHRGVLRVQISMGHPDGRFVIKASRRQKPPIS